MNARVPLAIALAACCSCAARDTAEPPPFAETWLARARPRIEIETEPGLALLSWLAGDAATPRPESVDRWVHFASLATGGSQDEIVAEIDAARAARPQDPIPAAAGRRFTLGAARAFHEEAADSIARASAALSRRRDIVTSRVARLLPDPSLASAPLTVLLVAGLSDAEPTLVAADEDRRVLLVDARALVRRVLGPLSTAPARGAAANRFADALGEELERVVAPELFHLAFAATVAQADSWRSWPMHDSTARAWLAMLDEGVAALLELPREQAIDERGLRPPQVDAEARRAFVRFETNLARLRDPSTPGEDASRLEWAMWNGTGSLSAAPRTEDDRWGTRVVLRMVEAVDKLGPPGRLRTVLARGPFELIEAYIEVSGRSASVPALSENAKDALRAIAREVRPPQQ